MEVNRIAVIGAGTMGRGIAYASAFGGFQTVLEDVNESCLRKAFDWIRGAFDEGLKREKSKRRCAMKRSRASRLPAPWKMLFAMPI